jgi:hypothetical protein
MSTASATTIIITIATDVGDANADADADDLPFQVCFDAPWHDNRLVPFERLVEQNGR